MSEVNVTSVSVAELLEKLRSREWLIPKFQREFVWTVQDVIDFTHSILFTRPIGMATIWAQSDNSQLELEPISLSDRNSSGDMVPIRFCETEVNPKKIYAVLDGRQRCTAIAIVFGGFHPKDSRFKHSGRYFLNVAEEDTTKQVVFLKEKEVKQNGFDKDAACIASGLFPLSSNIEKEQMLGQWYRYVQAIKDPAFYSNGQLPEAKELDRRDAILKKAFDGIIKTQLAVYIVPELFSLDEVCEIFETLNITGVKVSTVDLVHSWLYADTAKDARQFLLRDWIDEFGTKDGAIGWASSMDRPELIVQMATACHIALDTKPKPRPTQAGPKKDSEEISSVKAADLLRTPTQHWKNVTDNDTVLAESLKDFQTLVADGNFPWSDCPYPVSANIYVALRYHAYADPTDAHPWGRDDLNAIYKAFFWRNALTNRYDQGPLSQVGADIKELKAWLKKRREFKSSNQWATETTRLLDSYIRTPIPTKDWLIEQLTDEVPQGALGKALRLPLVAKADKDLLDSKRKIGFPLSSSGVEMHHIYPRGWCQINKVGKLAVLLDKDKAGRDWVNSIANLMPLSRESNNLWKNKPPGQVLVEMELRYEQLQDILRSAFIDKECFEYLRKGEKYIKVFWERRAALMADDLIKRMAIVI